MAEIKGSCQVVYQPDNPLSCGAVLWIEVLPDTVVIPQLFSDLPDADLTAQRGLLSSPSFMD